MTIGGADEKSPHRAARAAALALVLLVCRVAYLNHPTPVHGDETGFVGAIGFPAQYPVHHPGYPLWVAMGTALNAVGLSPYAAFQIWSVAASIVLPVLMYFGLCKGVREGLAWWTAAAFGVCPLVWFTGTTALNYAAGCCIGWIVVVLCHRALSEMRLRPLLIAAIVASVGFCLRADLLMVVGPVMVFAAWRLRRVGGLKTLIVLAGGVGVLIGATTLVYYRVVEPTPRLNHTIHVILDTSVFRLGLKDGLVRNAVKLGMNLCWHLGPAVLLLPVAIFYNARDANRHTRILLVLWWLPLTAFLLLVHMTEPGHMMPLVPIAYCLIAVWLNDRFKAGTATKIAAGIAVFSVLQFVAYPWSATSSGYTRLLDAKIAYVSGAGLRHIDQRGVIHTPGDFWQTAIHHGETPRPADKGGR